LFENSAIRFGEILAEINDSGVWKTEANYSTFKAYHKARQLKRIEDPLKRAEFWEKLNRVRSPSFARGSARVSGRRRQGDP
jgi:hypothetical protein